MPRAVIYARFSTDKQREESIEAQVRACTDYASANGHSIIEVYADRAQSGRTDKRPEFQRMLKNAALKRFDIVLVHKYNRFARRMSDHVRYEDKLNGYGASIIAVAEDFGTGKESVIMKALMRSLSEYYTIDLSDEVKKGHRENALKALHNGGYPPFGYDIVDKKYVINELEAAYVRKMFDCASNLMGFTGLIEEMAACGITGKRGKPIKYTQIYDMLRNEKFTGVYLYSPQQESSKEGQRDKPNAIRIDGAIPQIITKDQFEEVRAIMESRRQVGKKANHLCSGLVYCGCGAKMHGITTGHNREQKYKYYYCSAKCGAPNVRMEEVDAYALEYLKSLLEPEMQAGIAKALKKYRASSRYDENDFYKVRDGKVREKQKQYDALMQNLSTGTLPPEIVADVGARMNLLKSEIEALGSAEPPADYTPEHINGWLESIVGAPDEKAVRMLIEKITVKNRTDISVSSRLTSILGETGCGTRIRT